MNRQIGIFTKQGFKPNDLFHTMPDFWQKEIQDLFKHGVAYVAPRQVHVEDITTQPREWHIHHSKLVLLVDGRDNTRAPECPYYTLPTVRKIPLHTGSAITTYKTQPEERSAYDLMIDQFIGIAKAKAKA